jgi:hypothetical protein
VCCCCSRKSVKRKYHEPHREGIDIQWVIVIKY